MLFIRAQRKPVTVIGHFKNRHTSQTDLKLKKMELENLKSLEQASDRDLLTYIFATQLQILRRLDFLENEKERPSHFDTTKDMVSKVDSFTKRINEYLGADDEVKGMLRF